MIRFILISSLLTLAPLAQANTVTLNGKTPKGELCSIQFAPSSLAGNSSTAAMILNQNTDVDLISGVNGYDEYDFTSTITALFGKQAGPFAKDATFFAQSYPNNGTISFDDYVGSETATSSAGTVDTTRRGVITMDLNGKVLSYVESADVVTNSWVACSCDPNEEGCGNNGNNQCLQKTSDVVTKNVCTF